MITYAPSIKRASRYIDADDLPCVLLHHCEPPENAEEAQEIRFVADGGSELAPGVYVFEEGHDPSLKYPSILIVGAQAVQPEKGGTYPNLIEAPDFIGQAFKFFNQAWPTADQIPTPLFGVNDLARLRSDNTEVTIRTRSFQSGRWTYSIRMAGRNTEVSETALKPVEINDDPFDWIKQRPAGQQELMTTLTRTKLREHLSDTVYSFRSSRTLFRPYQFRPIMQLLRGGQFRLLIADEVGLGKTIEAGLVWTELEARRQANRVLVVCPPTLINKWQDEMLNRFGFELEILDNKGLGDFVERLTSDRVPKRKAWISSLNTLRSSKYLEVLNENGVHFDLIIADEAHAFRNISTKSYALGASLSDWADSLVFLSATPLNLGNDDLFNLMHLLSPGNFEDRGDFERRLEPNGPLNAVLKSLHRPEVTNAERQAMLEPIHSLTFGSLVTRRPEFEELDWLLSQPDLSHSDKARIKILCGELNMLSSTVTRTRKIDIQEDKARREVISVHVDWTDEERNLYNWIDKWQKEKARRSQIPIGFATQMPLRLASTCLPAFRDRLVQGHYGPPNSGGEDTARQFEEFKRMGGDLADLDDESVADALWLDQDVDNAPPEVIQAALELGDVDTKFDEFIKAITPMISTGRRLIVFTFSRPTVAYLSDRLTELGIAHAQLHGGVDKSLRGEIMQKFRNNEFQVVLATKVASEGLDFEFASAVVNYDLPWNPMEVEQRIGRIDRIGQEEEKIYIVNFHVPGTIETEIVERVMTRIGVFEHSIGELEPIMRETMHELQESIFDFRLTDQQREERIDQTLTAIEQKQLNLDDLQSATNYLQSTDLAEIEGLEQDLLTSGRYIGVGELLALIHRWISRHPNAYCRRSTSHEHLYEFRGTPELASQLEASRSHGSWPVSEVNSYTRAMTAEQVIYFSVDQEHARAQGLPLLSVRHPFVQAAIQHISDDEPRYSYVRVPSATLEAGVYVVVLALASWTGVRSTTEIWTCDVQLGSQELGNAAGNALLASIADGTIQDASDALAPGIDEVSQALDLALETLNFRHKSEEATKVKANQLLVDARRLSHDEIYKRAISQIETIIETLRAEGKHQVIPMHQGRLEMKKRARDEKSRELDSLQEGHLELETLGVALVEVVPKT